MMSKIDHYDQQHRKVCDHTAIQDGDHIDYIVDGRLDHPHDGHYDDHSPVKVIAN